MLLAEEQDIQAGDARSLLAFSSNRPIWLETWRLDRKNSGGLWNGETDGDCRICAAAGDLWVKLTSGEGNEFVGPIGGFSHESEHDLAALVSDFLENGSCSAESRYSSDSDSGFSEPSRLVEKILFHKNSVDQWESTLSSFVQSLLLSINDTDLSSRGSQCNGSCIRQRLAKLLRLSGYDSAVCASKWEGFGKVPGGDHEYMDVILSEKSGTSSDRLIIEIDFRSHFEIAWAVKSYDAILNSLPVIYVGSMSKLKHFLLQIMVDAAKFSLNQNSMPLPPWRSLPYLQAKWQSQYNRKFCPDENSNLTFNSSYHRLCFDHLKRLKSSLTRRIPECQCNFEEQ